MIYTDGYSSPQIQGMFEAEGCGQMIGLLRWVLISSNWTTDHDIDIEEELSMAFVHMNTVQAQKNCGVRMSLCEAWANS